ncbi:1-(5-phosphoribosyl)-5-[(5-phosphoribosylamino)methylideneamino] imidazole-4-carboxamide isomerase [bioreactor metagenome]|uniref:1-(5-phosphoribosyl)-5-[(5-phosphoribosylamino)methylideneamino] imidazole-4-carboxamide isomerase n=1 Tax=bioreactor metagenome TaxID=1076179 RepID=A0A645DGI3_9ZZZZ
MILGSAALKNPPLVKEAVKQYGEKIAVGIDAKEGYVSIDGWISQSDVYYLDFAKAMEDIGVRNIIFTDISRDGTLTGPNTKQLAKLQEAVSCDITASGGIKNMDHIIELYDMGLYAAIAGKAIYSKTLDLKQAIDFCKTGRIN